MKTVVKVENPHDFVVLQGHTFIHVIMDSMLKLLSSQIRRTGPLMLGSVGLQMAWMVLTPQPVLMMSVLFVCRGSDFTSLLPLAVLRLRKPCDAFLVQTTPALWRVHVTEQNTNNTTWSAKGSRDAYDLQWRFLFFKGPKLFYLFFFKSPFVNKYECLYIMHIHKT